MCRVGPKNKKGIVIKHSFCCHKSISSSQINIDDYIILDIIITDTLLTYIIHAVIYLLIATFVIYSHIHVHAFPQHDSVASVCRSVFLLHLCMYVCIIMRTFIVPTYNLLLYVCSGDNNDIVEVVMWWFSSYLFI